jgi:hypothetical protein
MHTLSGGKDNIEVDDYLLQQLARTFDRKIIKSIYMPIIYGKKQKSYFYQRGAKAKRNSSLRVFFLSKLVAGNLGSFSAPKDCYFDTRSLFQNTSRSAAAVDPKIERVQKPFPAPCRRGESPLEVFFIAMLASGAMSE